jgi:hypothetical protein
VGILDRDNSVANWDDEVDDEFPSIEELWRQTSRHGTLTEYQDSADTLHLEEFAVDTSRSRLSPESPRLDDSAGNSQGTQGTQQLFITVASSLLILHRQTSDSRR